MVWLLPPTQLRLQSEPFWRMVWVPLSQVHFVSDAQVEPCCQTRGTFRLSSAWGQWEELPVEVMVLEGDPPQGLTGIQDQANYHREGAWQAWTSQCHVLRQNRRQRPYML